MKKYFAFGLAIFIFNLACFSAFASAPQIDRFSSRFDDPQFTSTYLTNRMNCYGYALQLYYNGDGGLPYKQHPGEFADNTESFNTLMQSYSNSYYIWMNMDRFISDRMQEDAYTMNLTITETTASVAVPAGKRKIALAIRQESTSQQAPDIHYYLRHSDGSWSHKTGTDPTRSTSLNTNVPITDNNISTVGKEGGYSSSLRFYLISKDAIVDYPHDYGHGEAESTLVSFLDGAGDTITKSHARSMLLNYQMKFDYPSDIDFIKFRPTQTRRHRFQGNGSAGMDIDVYLYGSNGEILTSDISVGNAAVEYNLVAGKDYYLYAKDSKNGIGDYRFNFTYV